MTSLIRRLRTRIACFLVLPLGQLACVVDAAGVIVGDLGEGCGVDGVVELPVASGVEPVAGLGTRGRFNGGGAVVAGVVPGGREPADIAAVSEMIAAPIGPTPYRSMTVVLDASTAVTVRTRMSTRAWSRASSSVTNWRQVATRSAVIGSLIATPARSSTALPVLRDRSVPPSMSRHSRAWRRHTLRVRWAVSWW